MKHVGLGNEFIAHQKQLNIILKGNLPVTKVISNDECEILQDQVNKYFLFCKQAFNTTKTSIL